MINQERFDSIKDLIMKLRETNRNDTLTLHVIATGLAHLHTMQGMMNPKLPLSHSDIREFDVIVSEFEDIVVEHLQSQ